MWYFRSPEIVFGEDALEHLETLTGSRAFIVTDGTLVRLGLVDRVIQHLQAAGIDSEVFADVEQEPALQTVQQGAALLNQYQPDWLIGLGGGSAIDAAKAMWVLYENPNADLETLSPFEPLVLRQKARLIAIPTTSGTGSECTWAFVLTDTTENRKLGLGNPLVLPDIAIVDPLLPQAMPPQLTADTGFDVLTQAIEGYTSGLYNDFSDGLCLKATQLVFDFLPRAVARGDDKEAREKMHNAAALAGLGFGNSMAALAHALGHSLGSLFQVPHGRAVGLFLPYTIQFVEHGPGPTRFGEISQFLRLPNETATGLVAAIQQLANQIGQPQTIAAAIQADEATFEQMLPQLVAHAEADSMVAMSSRIPTDAEITALFRYAYLGQDVDF